MLMLLGVLAHNVIVRATRWLAPHEPKVRRYGPKRMVRDIFHNRRRERRLSTENDHILLIYPLALYVYLCYDYIHTYNEQEGSMPTKTIYVSDQDLPIFEQAQALAGDSLSATIIQALRHFIEQQEARARAFRTVELEVGKLTTARKRFTGRLLAKTHIDGLGHTSVLEKFEVYETTKGNLVVYLKRLFGERDQRPERRLDIYSSLDDLKGHIPDELYHVVVQKRGGDDIEVLDV